MQGLYRTVRCLAVAAILLSLPVVSAAAASVQSPGGSAAAVRDAAGATGLQEGEGWPAVIREANRLYDEAVRTASEDPVRADQLFAASASGFRRVITEGALDNAPLHYNLGNAEARRQRVGHAIAAYLRAERLAPGDAKITRNLAVVRARIETRIDGALSGVLEDRGVGGALLRPITWVHESSPPRTKLWLFVIAAWVFWAMLGVRMWCSARARPRVPARRLVALPFVIALLTSGSLAADVLLPPRSVAVVVDEPCTARTGPDTGYGVAFTEALSPGVELLVLERRSGWVFGRFADGSTAWVDENAVDLVEVR